MKQFDAYERLRVTSILRAMTRESRKTHPYWPFARVWEHIDQAMEIMNDTRVLDRAEREAVVQDEYDNWRGANDG